MTEKSMLSSFVNIDLNGDVMENVDSEERLSTNLTIDNVTPVTTVPPQSCSHENNKIANNKVQTNDELDKLSKQLMSDYAKYFHLKPTSQIDDLNECIDNLLTHMEEFYNLIEMIRDNGNTCLDQLSVTLEMKLSQCKNLFRLIDKLERIVNFVSKQINSIEAEVCKAEKMMQKKNTVTKIFSLISNHSSLQNSRYTYVPPEIFKTEDLMKL